MVVESGPDFRPLDLGWVRDMRDRCVSMRIPLFLEGVSSLKAVYLGF